MSTGWADGEPDGANCSLAALILPELVAMVPFEFACASMSATIPIPLLESTRPAATGSSFLICRFAWKGVSAASFSESGPALPLSLSVPPAGRLADSSNGNDLANENCFTPTATSEYTKGLLVAGTEDTVTLPLSMVSRFTVRSGMEAGFCADSGLAAEPPMLEKFHFPARF